jgi:chromosome segregation ATPase
MANPRELAEQAIALLQNALSESEARASDLDEQLKRKRAPKNRLEEQLDVLTHRLESVDAERQHWRQQAGHLEEVAEAERAKVAQLKKKLEIAESGPEKLTKKEINFWRQKSETIDSQIKEYQERLTAVRRELNERDSLIEQLRATSGNAEAPPRALQTESDDELRRQLEQRDAWLAELRLELHELRAEPAPPLETQAEVEMLRDKITTLERALGEANNMRAAVQAELMRMQHEIAERERAIRDATLASERERALREAAAADERARATLMEREHRIVELSAEVEYLRNDSRQREGQQREQVARHNEEVGSLTRDLVSLRARLDEDRNDSAADLAALEIALHEREQETDKQRQLLTTNEHDFQELSRQLAQREQVAAEARRELEEQHRELQARDRELAEREQQLRDLNEALAERDQRFASSTAEIEHLRATFAAQSHDVDKLRQTLLGTRHELEQARATLTVNERELMSLREASSAAERELTSLREALLASSRELDDLRIQRQRLERVAAEAEAYAAATANDIAAAREQMSGLETELKEEREHAESLGELANERREHMTKLQEQVEEAEERFAEANWKLGKALHFERIVKRRKGLVLKLLEALRAKMKSNVALKAGLDGLRTFKATAEMNQHKLLQRIDALKADLKDADETVKRHQGGTAAKEELTNAISRAAALEERLNTQAELIQALEGDLKKARLAQKPAEDKSQQVERLTKELETKNQVIAALEADTENQQRKLSKLRGTESETARLKALTEKDRSEIDGLQREVLHLRETLAEQSRDAAAAASSHNAELEAKLKERESSLTRLMGTIKEHEATIKKLTESSDSWKRKYQFLASDQPDEYKNAAEK